MTIFYPFFNNRHPEISCWNCKHVEYLVPIDPPPQDPEDNYALPRAIQCRRTPALQVYWTEMEDYWEYIWEGPFTVGEYTEDSTVWPVSPDGTNSWCTCWRKMKGTPPTPPVWDPDFS